MKCIIHVGLHHTATTSLQRILSEEFDYLKKIGILYPKSIQEAYQHSLLPGSYFPNHYALSNNRNVDAEYYIKLLQKELSLGKYNLCVISSEVFSELMSIKKNYLKELFNKLDSIFDDISIMITTRNEQVRAFSMQKAQIRLSVANDSFRKEIFNAPKRFRNKVNGTKNEIDRWKILKKNIIIINMENFDSPIKAYINKIISQLDSNENFKEESAKYFDEIISSRNYILNKDSYLSINYLLLILIGMKIRNAEEELKENLTLDFVCNFVKECGGKIKHHIFQIEDYNIISFLDNYKIDLFQENEVKSVLKKAEVNFSSRTIILKLIDDIILELIYLTKY